MFIGRKIAYIRNITRVTKNVVCKFKSPWTEQVLDYKERTTILMLGPKEAYFNS